MDKNQAKKILAQIEKKKALLGIQNRDIAHFIGVCEKTFREKIREPEKFSLREIYQIMHLLRFTEEEKKEALL